MNCKRKEGVRCTDESCTYCCANRDFICFLHGRDMDRRANGLTFTRQYYWTYFIIYLFAHEVA